MVFAFMKGEKKCRTYGSCHIFIEKRYRMMDHLTRARVVPNEVTQEPTYLTAKPRQESKVWRMWYSLASSRDPGRNAPFQEMERFRRSRTGSTIILPLFVLLLVAIPAGYVGTNSSLIPIVIGSFFTLGIATVFNRLGKVNVAGVLVVLTFLAFPILSIITTQDGLSVLILPLYGLLVLPLLCAVSFLPAWWVFVVAAGNCIFTWVSLMYLPRTAELSALLTIALAGTITPIILVQMSIAIVAYFWVQSSTQAIMRADRAEELARLEHDMASQAEKAAQEKQQLEASIQKIVETHMRVANGEFSARVPLGEGNVLWRVAVPLNNLIKRAESWRAENIRLRNENRILLQSGNQIGQSSNQMEQWRRTQQ
jgi:hypothetical protein